jgi:hypothetical protein
LAVALLEARAARNVFAADVAINTAAAAAATLLQSTAAVGPCGTRRRHHHDLRDAHALLAILGVFAHTDDGTAVSDVRRVNAVAQHDRD